MKLTPKQQAFADYYITNGGNATDAALRAGYSKKTASEMGYENLNKPHIKHYLEEEMEKVAERNKWTVDKLIKKFQEVAAKCDNDEKFDSSGANKAFTEIGKLCGFYTEKIETTERHIVVEIEDDGDEDII